MRPNGDPDEKQVEILLGTLLRWGTILSAAIIAVGGFAYVVEHGTEQPHFATFLGEPTSLRSLSGVLSDSLALDGRGIMQLGLLVLIATPVGRVVASLGAFAWRRDAAYVVISAIVLAALLYSLLAS
ncbi:MAG TPA: DUF1634 domain-containing protein [Pirellulales bacterium]|nr:DUF1634 domain-containing protein [Pirellulales bacterium]